MSGALERRLKPKEEKRHKKEKKEKKHKKEKKKKHSGHRKEGASAPSGAASDSDSSSDAEPEGGGGGDGGGKEVAAPPAITPAGTKAEGVKARAAAGLDWMQRQPARVDSRGDPVAPPPKPQDAAAAAEAEAAKTRISRELNPYAAEGREINDWTHAKHGEAGSDPTGAARGRGLGDGGQSFLLKKMARAVEEVTEQLTLTLALALALAPTLTLT